MQFFPSRQIIFSIGDIDIRWYGLMYVLSFGLVYFLGKRLQKYRDLQISSDNWLFVIFISVLGAVVGGRLGYVLFYEPAYYVHHWLEIFLVSRGGMSAHGGIIGAAIGVWVAAKKTRCDFWRLIDVLIVPAALSLALGRIGNFINQELYGTITTLLWGVTIPGVLWPRHPWPIYEAITNTLLAFFAYISLRKFILKPGIVTLGFVMSYSLIRFFLEYVRDLQWPFMQLGSLALSPGQVLSLLIFVGGGFLMIWLLHLSKTSTKN